MRNFEDAFETCKRSFINAFLICMTVHSKDDMEVKDKKVLILWGFTEKSDVYEGFTKKTMYRGDCLKRGLGQFADLRGGMTKKSEW